MTPVSKLATDYLNDHWRGQHSISQSFWVNLLAPQCILLFVHLFLVTPRVETGQLDAVTTTALLAATYAILLIWQITGLSRAISAEVTTGARPVESVFIHASLIVLVLFISIKLIDTLLSSMAYDLNQTEAKGAARDDSTIGLTFAVSDNARIATIQGVLGVGATRLVEEMLDQQPSVDTLVFNSSGGSVFEGRGLGILIKNLRLSTHVVNECLSACTLAFAGGVNRTAAVSAQFGFHAYRVDALYDAAWINIDAQQEKDIAWFEQQGIKEQFRTRVYQQESTSLWIPERAELLGANFLTE